jgi:hypothetical protein
MRSKHLFSTRFSAFVSALCLAGLGLFTSQPSEAADRFDKLPAGETGKSSDLLIRIVEYAGSTNGAITVDVKNPTDKPQEFSAMGLYFVPQGNANEAPQRLGAVGPFRLQAAGGVERRERLTIGPRETARLILDVYCIDSHRSSPGAATAFRVARDRVPARLTRAINDDALESAAPLGGLAAPAAKSAVQSQVWKNRNKSWIPLDGEGKQEAAKNR